MNSEIKLFSGNANLPLAHDIADKLGFPLGRAKVSTFSDGEVQVELADNVRGRDVFLIQPTSAPAQARFRTRWASIPAPRRARIRWATRPTTGSPQNPKTPKPHRARWR